ncbi:hypothetical protein RUND412_009868 [Rhizina undulata]
MFRFVMKYGEPMQTTSDWIPRQLLEEAYGRYRRSMISLYSGKINGHMRTFGDIIAITLHVHTEECIAGPPPGHCKATLIGIQPEHLPMRNIYNSASQANKVEWVSEEVFDSLTPGASNYRGTRHPSTMPSNRSFAQESSELCDQQQGLTEESNTNNLPGWIELITGDNTDNEDLPTFLRDDLPPDTNGASASEKSSEINPRNRQVFFCRELYPTASPRILLQPSHNKLSDPP